MRDSTFRMRKRKDLGLDQEQYPGIIQLQWPPVTQRPVGFGAENTRWLWCRTEDPPSHLSRDVPVHIRRLKIDMFEASVDNNRLLAYQATVLN